MANPSIVVDFLADTAKLVAGMGDVGKAGQQAGKGFDAKSLLKWTGAAVAIGAGAKFLHGASEATTELAKNTIALQRVTGLDTRTASEWVSMLESRNIETGTFQTSLGRLSKTMETARTKSNDAAVKIRSIGDEMAAVRAKGGPEMEKDLGKLATQMDRAQAAATKARAPFAALGVNFQKVKAGRISEVILEAADAISKMESPTKRAAAAQALFGKAGLKLLPILQQGRKGIEDNLKMTERYGATLGDKQVAQVKKVASAQKQLALAHKGVQIAIGSALLPAQAELYGSLLHIVQAILPFTQNINVMKGVLIAGAAAFGIYKAAVIATAIAEAASSPALIAFGAAVWASIGPIALVVAGIAALIAIGYLLYKHWDALSKLAGTVWNAIKAAAMSAFNWIKSNWPLLLPILLGPIGVAAALIIRHWAQIRAAVTTALNAIRSAVQTAWRAIVSIVTTTGNAIRAAVVAAWNAVKSAVSSAMGAIRSVVSAGFSAVVAVVRAAVSALVAAIRGGVGRAKAAATAIKDGVKAVFGGAIGWLVAAGIAIVDGLAKGIRAAIGNAVSAIKEAGHAVVSAGLSVLHIGSPSRDFVRMGTQVSQGLADGIKAGIPAAEKAARAMAQRTVDAAKAVLQTRAGGLQNYIQQAFQAKTAAAQTPAEKALADLQAAHDEAGRQQALAAAQAQMAAATTDEERLSAQQAYTDAAYAIQVAALQKQADAEAVAQAGQQFVQQQNFDKSLAALNTYLGSAHATARGARVRINKLMADFGLDFATIGTLLGSSFSKGLTDSIGEVTKAAGKLAAAVKAALKKGLKIGSPSKVAVGYGHEVARGLALGITRHAGLVDRAMRTLMPTAATLGADTTAQIQTATGPVSVRVFIGDTELRGMVRAEISGDNTRIARRLLAGSR